MAMASRRLDLFGGSLLWLDSQWIAADDRVRGGRSQSFLEIPPRGNIATFKGNLNTTSLGGVGFASQCTIADDATWDLSDYDGTELIVRGLDAKQYTLVLKDQLPPSPINVNEHDRRSTISYEFDFRLPPLRPGMHAASFKLLVLWENLRPVYRGGPEDDAPILKTSRIRRFGIMCRSHFGEQKGRFDLDIERISAVKLSELASSGGYLLMDEVEVNERSPLLRRPTTAPRSVHSETESILNDSDYPTVNYTNLYLNVCLGLAIFILLSFIASLWLGYCALAWFGSPPISYRNPDGSYGDPPLVDKVFCGMRRYEPYHPKPSL